MKKKGFTLVELLAVIAILAILVIITLPNIMSLFNEAKENSFKNELKEIYKTAQNQWMSDAIFNTDEIVYSRVKNEVCSNKLKLSGREEINYYIKIDKGGNVIEYYAEDGTYQYSYNSPVGLKIEDINQVSQISNIKSYEEIKIDCNGASSPEYTVKLNVINGSGSTSKIVKGGNTTTFSVSPNTGYGNPTISGGTLNNNTFTTSIIENDTTYTITYTANSYSVNVVCNHCTSSPSSRTVTYNSSPTFTITASSGYTLTGASVNGTRCSLSGSRLTVSSVAGNTTCTITAVAQTSNYTWKFSGFDGNYDGNCARDCRSFCSSVYHTSIWSCSSSRSIAPSSSGNTSGNYCWCAS